MLEQVSHFRITGQIGAGGMGVVYRAVDLRLHRAVALKLLPADPGLDPDRRQRFLHEGQAASALNHPNIVTIFEVDSVEGLDFIAMELVEGRSLQQLIGEAGLAPDRALSYATQIAEALACAHAGGIVHRDLKPSNVMVTRDERVKVLDFGIAKRIGDTGPSDPSLPTQEIGPQTQEGVVVGTPQYMSPEQASGKPVDARSDVFCFGAVLYTMLAGRPPFEGDSAGAVVSAVLRDTPRPLRERRPELPEEVLRIVGKCLQKAPGDRYQQAADIVADLRRVERGGGTPTSASQVSRVRPGRVAALAALLALIAGAAWLMRPQPAPAQFHLLSTFSGSHGQPSLSPDGGFVAFSQADAKGVAQIWVKNVAQGDPVAITSGERPAARPRWSPKNDQVVFQSAGALWSVPPLGGPPRRLIDGGSSPNWSRDGEWLVFEGEDGIGICRSTGQEARTIAGVPKKFFFVDRAPALSPDGRLFVYFQAEEGPFGDLWIAPATGGTPRRLTFDTARGGQPVWTPDGREIVFSSSRAGGLTLWRVAASGGAPQPVTSGAGEDAAPDLSRDGRRLVYVNTRNAYAVAWLDPKTGTRRTLAEQRTDVVHPSFSPEGERVVFFGEVGPDNQLFTARSDGSELRQLTHEPGERNIMPSWSHDGASIFFYRVRPNPSFRRMSAGGGPSETVVAGWKWTQQYRAAVDPAGQRVAYDLYEGGERRASVVRSLVSGREDRLAVPLTGAVFSPDGTSLAGWDSGAARILRCSVDRTDCRPLAAQAAGYPCWSKDGRHVYFPRMPAGDIARAGVRDLWRAAADGGSEERVAELDGFNPLRFFYDVARTGEIVWSQYLPGRQELWATELP